MDFTVNGVRIPLAYTIWAKKELTDTMDALNEYSKQAGVSVNAYHIECILYIA